MTVEEGSLPLEIVNLPVLPASRWTELSGREFGTRGERVNRFLRPSGWQLPPGLMIACWAAEWVIVVEAFREWELCLVADDSPPTIPSTEHRTLLQSIIERGEMLSKAWEERQDVPAMEFTLDDFKATVEGMRETFRADYEPKLDLGAKRDLMAQFQYRGS
jgi:hypothetical protein